MKILIVSDEAYIIKYIQSNISNVSVIKKCDFDHLNFAGISNDTIDFVVIFFDKSKTEKKEFSIILTIRCKINVPIFAILENATVQDKMNVLSLGAELYMDYQEPSAEINSKFEEAFRWSWFYKWKR